MLPVVLLALFPVLLMFNTPLAGGVLLLAIVVLYRKRAVPTRRRAGEAPDTRSQSDWKDPWATGGLGR